MCSGVCDTVSEEHGCLKGFLKEAIKGRAVLETMLYKDLCHIELGATDHASSPEGLQQGQPHGKDHTQVLLKAGLWMSSGNFGGGDFR